MEVKRRAFQGVLNIIRFNWHFYVLAFVLLFIVFVIRPYLPYFCQPLLYIGSTLALLSLLLSLLVSLYVYDLSGLYALDWIEVRKDERLIVNIHAGFDETSALLQHKFKHAELIALDFYDPLKHTELSIKRARKAYPSYPGTRLTHTTTLELPDNSVDKLFVIFSAHEIRDEQERTLFFQELARILKPEGQLYLTEHLRDVPNFLAYNIGFFHFYPRASWLRILEHTAFRVQNETKLSPFVSTFLLSK